MKKCGQVNKTLLVPITFAKCNGYSLKELASKYDHVFNGAFNVCNIIECIYISKRISYLYSNWHKIDVHIKAYSRHTYLFYEKINTHNRIIHTVS